MIDVDALAQEIRRVDGNNSLGAGALAEALMPFLVELTAADEKEIKRLRRVATDRQYMIAAYRNMLGPIGLQVAEMWDEKGAIRVHFSWGPNAHKMTGEERAQFILDLEGMPMREITDLDSELPYGEVDGE